MVEENHGYIGMKGVTIVTFVSWILLIFAVLLTGILLITTGLYGKKYKPYILPLRSDEYLTKPLLPYGLFLLDLIWRGHPGEYGKKLLRKTGFIYGLDYAPYYYQIHMAGQLVYMTVFEIILCFFGIVAKSEPLFLALLILCPAILFFLCDRVLDEIGEKRLQEIRKDFPDFVGKITLLMGAGLNVRQTFEKIGSDSLKDSPLYAEIKRTVSELQSGKSEIECYQTFAERIRIPEGNRLIGIIIQNIRIGGAAMLRELESLSGECLAVRKNNAYRLAEEAQAKLIFPMILMFIAVLLTVMTPAILSMRGLI
jgi:tight adherence protein C